jgi:DNA repair protein RadA/Sms
VSSLRNQSVPNDVCVFGEIGLSGEVRPVPSGEERIREAAKHGFKTALVPEKNAPRKAISGIRVVPVRNIQHALEELQALPATE